MKIRIGLENDPTVKGSENKVFVGTETRDMYGLARTEQSPSWNVSTYVVERELMTGLSEITQKSMSKTKKYPMKGPYQSPIEQFTVFAEEMKAQKEETKIMLPDLKRK